MPELRWILIILGSALLIGIYIWGRRNAKADVGEDSMFRPEPDFESRANVEPSIDVPEESPSYASDDAIAQDDPFDAEPSEAPTRAYVPVRVASTDESREPTIEVMRTREPTIEVMRAREPRVSRIEPTFGDETQTAELPVNEPASAIDEREIVPDTPPPAPPPSEAPTIGMSSTPQPRRIERRKIIALRVAAGPQRLPGAQLQAAFDAESLQHGKYDVFHRLDDQGAAIFSVASMVEPGTFNPEKMASEHYPGITLFAQLPGPVAGMLAFNELVACSRRLHASLGGTLQDERGVPLTVHRIERIRQEIREFEHRPAAEGSQRASPTYSP